MTQAGNVLGLDVEGADQLANLMTQTAQQFNESSSNLTNQLHSVQWTGTYANNFRDGWDNQAKTNLANIANMLEQASQQLKQAAQAQRTVSGN
jgi:uncharacterized protein YukE